MSEKEVTIHGICQLIHQFIQVDVEYFDTDRLTKKRILTTTIPPFLQNQIAQSLLTIENIFIQEERDDLYYFKDEHLHLHFLGKGIWQNSLYKGTIVIGPFLSETIPSDFFEQMSFSEDSVSDLKHYFKQLAVLGADRLQALNYLLTHLVPQKMIVADLIGPDESDVQLIQRTINENENSYAEIEAAYKAEKDIYQAVEIGDSKQAAIHLNALRKIDLTYRNPGNPLRTYKNLGFSLNAALRNTVARIGVNAIYIHLLSNKIALLIENVKTTAELESIQEFMIIEYCDLVNSDRAKQYSPIIKEAVTHIQLHYFDKLSLSFISKKLNINPTYLSKRFKIETGKTITHYIQDIRISHAKQLIKENNLSITDIALTVGFDNLNYFCTIFKKQTGVTPRRYFEL